ncbi:DNA topoisomerase 2-binding protein 1 [Planococcus citri]|uniref:DNA topoisomerase 2-binding protein 1 n=1 Tax=Planococcus citri TaxID=170843 RepID=UPI0031F7901E
MQIRKNNDRIEIYFVIKSEYKNENEVSDDMQLAFMNSIDFKVNVKWIGQSELLDVLNDKGRVFVFEEFQDELIKRFQETHPNARILGPRCLLSCFMENIPVPNTLSPVFNMAMDKLVVCTSRIPPKERAEIEKLVGYMGGEFTVPLTSRTTHLIVTSALTQRHFIACEKGMSVMIRGWVEEMWELNLKDSVKATDYNIAKKYSCPIFYNLKVTGSSISLEEKSILERKINSNGGNYSKDLKNKETNVLITPTAGGEKFKYAVRWRVPCVHPRWVDECIRKGHTVPFENYIVRTGSEMASTQVPKHVSQRPVSLTDTNESEISIIPSNNEKNLINDTETRIHESTMERCLPSREASEFKTPTKTCPRRGQQPQVSQCNVSMENNLSYKEVLSDINLQEVKKCGPIFDGCKLYLAGFNTTEEEKLRKILNHGGALRFTELNESITHIVVGNPSSVEMQTIKNIPNRPHVVKLNWLCDSIKQKSVAKEASCAFFGDEAPDKSRSAPQQPSPLSKKGYQILNPEALEAPTIPPVPISIDRNLIEKYSQSSQEIENCRPEPVVAAATPAVSVPAVDSTGPAPSENLSIPQSSTLFTGLKFAIIGQDESATETFKNTIIEYGGTVVSDNRVIVDYVIAPIVLTHTKVTYHEIVTMMWLEDCLLNMKVMPVKYYHLPISYSFITAPKPLTGCVITLSAYERLEKKFLENLVTLLGAKCQEILSKKDNDEKNVKKTTHLVCALPRGEKYDAAKKWNLPIVTEMWIQDCFKKCTKLPVEDYLTMFVRCASEESSSSQNSKAQKSSAEPRPSGHVEPEPSTSKSVASRRSISNEEIPNFCAAATSTKVGDILKDVNKCSQNATRRYAFRSTEKITPPVGNVCSVSSASRSSSPVENVNKLDEHSRASRSNNGPTSLILEMNASKGRNTSSIGKRKSRDDSSDRKQRSPKKKAIGLDKHQLTPVEEVGWHDTLTDLSHRDSGPSTGSQSSQRRSQRNPAASSKSEKPVPEKSGTSAVKQPRLVNPHNIMLSLEIERDKIEERITNLGGTVVATYEPDSETADRGTHLIIDDLKKTEKMLCSMAAGLWILRSSYLKACFENNAFVQEEDHEWGNPKTAEFLENANAETKQLAEAAHRWRIKILKEGLSKRPFVGMKAVIANPTLDGVVLSIQRIIRAGGGRILQPKDILKATHCFMKSYANIEHVPAPLEVLANERTHVLPYIYLRDFLIYHPPPDPKTRYPPEYLKLFK